MRFLLDTFVLFVLNISVHVTYRWGLIWDGRGNSFLRYTGSTERLEDKKREDKGINILNGSSGSDLLRGGDENSNNLVNIQSSQISSQLSSIATSTRSDDVSASKIENSEKRDSSTSVQTQSTSSLTSTSSSCLSSSSLQDKTKWISLPPPETISKQHRNPIPIIDALCQDCKVSLVNYTESSFIEDTRQIESQLFLIEKGCLVREIGGGVGLNGMSAGGGVGGGVGGMSREKILLHSYAGAGTSLSLGAAAKNQADKLVGIWTYQAGNKDNKGSNNEKSETDIEKSIDFSSLPSIPKPHQNQLYPGIDIDFKIDPWDTTAEAKLNPLFTIGSGAWDTRKGDENLAAAGTPFASLGVETFHKTSSQSSKKSSSRPTIIVNAHLFGQFYHTFADLIVPLYTTLNFLKWKEADVWFYHAVGIGDKDVGPWRYWNDVMVGFVEMSAELGLFLGMEQGNWKFGEGRFPQFVGDVEMWPRRMLMKTEETDKHNSEDNSNSESGEKSNSLKKNDKILAPATPWKTGRYCPSEDTPLVFGALQEARQCGQICFGADEFRPSVAPVWQKMNDVLWENSVKMAKRLVGRGEQRDEVGQERLFTPLLESFKDKFGSDATISSSSSSSEFQDPNLKHVVFIVRRSGKRIHKNQEELEQIYHAKFKDHFLKKLKLQVHFLDFEKIRFPDEQRALLSQTSALIGVAGAGLIQQWWLPPNARIIQIGCAKCDFKLGMHENRKPIMFFSRASTQLQQPFLHYVQLSGEKSIGRGGKQFLTPEFVDPEHFWKMVGDFLEKTGDTEGVAGCMKSSDRNNEKSSDQSNDPPVAEPKYLRPVPPSFCLVTDDKERDDGRDLNCFPPVGWPGSKTDIVSWMDAGSTAEEKRAVKDFWEELKNGR